MNAAFPEEVGGSMTQQLHIGVMRGGKLVDGRLVAPKSTVSAGLSVKNTFRVAGADLPREHVLFRYGKSPSLHVISPMRGEVALDGRTPRTLAELAAAGDGHPEGFAVALPTTARGWVSLGDTAFYFHLGQPPAPAPRATLPPEARIGLFGRLEKRFVLAFVAVVLVELLALLAVHARPDVDPDAPAQAEDLDRFAEIIMPEKPKDEPPPKAEEKKPDAEKPAAEEKKAAEEKPKDEEPAPEAEPDEAAQKAAEERRAEIREKVQKVGLLAVLGSAGSSVFGSVATSNGGLPGEVDKALDGVKGVQAVATSAAADPGARKGGSGGSDAATIGDIGAGGKGGREVALAEKKHEVVPQIQLDEPEIEPTGADVDRGSLGKFIKMRLKSVQGCYEKELKLNPALKGKVVVRFVIRTTGRVGDVSIDQNTMGSDGVGGCIVNLVRNWVFPMKLEEDTPVSFPFVFSSGG
ncbi:MAG: hypothetical protein RL199_912 [Pseudomonadota bacterium]|jgi:outer membrane biosynthesis protein TonB